MLGNMLPYPVMHETQVQSVQTGKALNCVSPSTHLHIRIPKGTSQCRFKSGSAIFNGDGLNYLGNPGLVHAQSIIATLACQACSSCSCDLEHTPVLCICTDVSLRLSTRQAAVPPGKFPSSFWRRCSLTVCV